MKSHELQQELINTSAIFGRNKDSVVVFQGEDAYTDGTKIVLPAMPEGVEMTQQAVEVMRGYLDHEAGHLRHTNFPEYQKFGEKYGDDGARSLNWIEDMYIERKVMEEYVGAERNLTNLVTYTNEKEREYFETQGEALKEHTPENICSAIAHHHRWAYGACGEGSEELYNYYPVEIKRWAEYYSEKVLESTSTKYNAELIEHLMKALENDPEMKQDPQDAAGKDFVPSKEALEQKSSFERNSKGEAEAQGKGGKDKGVLTDKSEIAKDILGGSGSGYQGTVIPKGKAGGNYRVYSTAKDEVFKKGKEPKQKTSGYCELINGTIDKYEKAVSKMGIEVNLMKSRLRRALIARESRDWDSGHEFGRLDTKRLTSAVLGSRNVYKVRKEREELSTSVLILVDLSGSMSGSKANVAEECAIAMAQCFEGTFIKYEIVGFCNVGGYPGGSDYGGYSRVEPLKIFEFKNFNDSLHHSKNTLSTIAECVGGNNSDRDAIMWSMNRLLQQDTQRKVLFVLSDGSPAHYSCHSGGELMSFAKDAAETASKKGVECVGVGIQDSSVKHIYKNHVVVNDLKELAGTSFSKLCDILLDGKMKL